MDLNNDNEISESELLRYHQVNNYDPIDLEGHLPPFTPIQGKVFDYLRCRPSLQATDASGLICAVGYTIEDLKAVLPSLLPLGNIIDDPVSFEAYVDHEFSLRDIDYDGTVQLWEQ